MNRRHFEAIAQSINLDYHTTDEYGQQVIRDVIDGLILEFKKFNPNFNAAKFQAACTE